MIRRIVTCKGPRYSGADLDVAFQLFRDGLVCDGSLASKASRNYLVDEGYAVRKSGYQALTGKGTIAFLTHPRVWLYLFRRWKRSWWC